MISKTAYRIILEDDLKPYDFWGCTDLDLVYGQIDKFVFDDLLKENDVIAARPWYLTGFFFLFRNNDRINNLYKLSSDYKTVFQNSDHFSFTEFNFAWQQLRNGKSIFEANTEIESMTEVIRREEQNGLQSTFCNMAWENVGWRPIVWDQGIITEGNKVWLLFHFITQKNDVFFRFLILIAFRINILSHDLEL